MERQIKELSNIGIFKHLTRSVKSKIVNSIHNKVLSKGEVLFKENEDFSKLYIVKEGVFEIYKEFKINTEESTIKYELLKISKSKIQK